MIFLPGETFKIYMLVLLALTAVCGIIYAVSLANEKRKAGEYTLLYPDAAKIFTYTNGPINVFVQLVDGAKTVTFSGKTKGIFIAPGDHKLNARMSKKLGRNTFTFIDGALEVSIQPYGSYRITCDAGTKKFGLEEYTP